MGWFSDATGGAFDSSPGKPATFRQAPWQKSGIKYVKEQLGNVANLPARQIAGMSDAEKQQQTLLNRVMQGQAFQDPRTSDLYQGLRAQSMADEQAGVDALRRRAQQSGMYASGGGMNAEAKFRADAGAQRQALLGQLFNQERARDNEYSRMAAAAQYGQLPRQLQQQQMDANFNQQFYPITYGVPLAQALMGHQENIFMRQPVESDFNKYATLASLPMNMVGSFGGIGGMGGGFMGL